MHKCLAVFVNLVYFLISQSFASDYHNGCKRKLEYKKYIEYVIKVKCINNIKYALLSCVYNYNSNLAQIKNAESERMPQEE